MFDKALIANRGEIACRIARTMRRMGVASVAVYSQADEDAMHVKVADEAFCIGAASARDSYLCIERILEAARRSGAGAIHPGYGFLSENADFAERCVGAGLVFIGPPASAMRLMGSKAHAKDLMTRLGVPVLPGYQGVAQDDETLDAAAAKIGFPVVVKASAGGGGRGMRVVFDRADMAGALASARREALGAFGDSRLLIEKYLVGTRHVEIQLFADACGGVVAFPPRDCSMQRNHQKVVEETPAHGLDPELAATMRAAATKAARASNYGGAGTVEFLVQGRDCYFLEMNARLQVEHTVTEMISGLDLVEWQLRVAAGEPLPLTQEELKTRGWAIEARICAENPDEGFTPSTGRIVHLHLPERSGEIRIDSGVREGDRISSHYDPLLAKLVVFGEDRKAALRKLQKALGDCQLVGVATNLDFLRALAATPGFVAGEYDTRFVGDFRPPAHKLQRDDERVLFAAAAAAWLKETRCARKVGAPLSPWDLADGWRLYDRVGCPIAFQYGSETFCGAIRPFAGDFFEIERQTARSRVKASWSDKHLTLLMDGARRDATVIPWRKGFVVILAGRNHYLERLDPLAPVVREPAGPASIIAPLPARVIRVHVRSGDQVTKGETLLLLEAMKMEIAVTAPGEGEIESVFCKEGDSVREGADLVRLAERRDVA